MRTSLSIALLLTSLPLAAQELRQLADPSAAGWDTESLAAARARAEEAGSAAVLALHRGRVVVAWGEVERRFKCHSVRKSILSALCGIAAEKDLLDLDATLADLGIDDREPLSETEASATVLQLMRARSGIYHPAAKEPMDMKRQRPERHTRAPGEAFFYNNWDFNVAGVVFEESTGLSVFAAFAEWLAGPLGMEDWRARDGSYELEPSNSLHPAFAFRLSARDLARFGQLFAQRGSWEGQQVVPADWVRDSTATVSSFGDSGRGYGAMWWTYARGALARNHPTLAQYDSFHAAGTGGQMVLVVPEAEFVYVHRGDTDNDRRVSGGPAWRIAEAILASAPGESDSEPETVTPLTASPFEHSLPAPAEWEARAWSAAELEEFLGTYDAGPLGEGVVHRYENRLFIRLPRGMEQELLKCGAGDYRLRVGAPVRAQRAADGQLTGFVVEDGPLRITARRVGQR